MVIDARERFAKRVATWIMASSLSETEITIRLACFDDEFNELVVKASRELRAA